MSTTSKFKTKDLVMVPLFVALMAIGANVTSFLVIGGVPITLQAIFAIMAGALLGSKLGAIAMTVYMLVGLVGAPIFAQLKGGLATLVSPTFGFILSFILIAYVTGKIIEKASDASLKTFLIACYTGLAITYILGTNYMYFAYITIAQAPEGFTYGMAWAWMIAPLIKDLIVTAIGAVICERVYNATRKNARSLNAAS
ncbi:biotin transporter BioY [Alkalihalobacterium chitinilyticum]|uniref:Biotin transporter n=1 Tax=Alkalihalobacterium chitinilyticum TaxID=2980103 RepID=A0ABT5VIT0_9BACI|nr:biotin transporter BioY [Alkalihalobacterium chitinilyticum]MDE5415361.1 biotin transporter BioY [Alkalihalobacterium chitinilyticum]